MRIICVDRNTADLSRLARCVSRIVPQASVQCCRDPKEALAFAADGGCDVLLSELDLGSNKREGIKLAESVKKINPTVNIIFITAVSERECAEELLRLRVSGFIIKPLDEEALAEEFRNLRYPVDCAVNADTQADDRTEKPMELTPEQMENVSGGAGSLGVYESGFRHKDEALEFFRECVGDEAFIRAMNSNEGRRHHYVAARICLDQAEWEKFVWIEKYGSLDGFPNG